MSIRRQNIVDNVAARMNGITTGAGYYTNLGAHVFVWRSANVEDALLPCIIVRDHINTFELEGVDTPLSKLTQLLTVDIAVICAQGSTSDDLVRKMMVDVYRAVGVDDTWGGYAITTRIVSDEILVDQQEKTIGGALVKLEIMWRTDKYQES